MSRRRALALSLLGVLVPLAGAWAVQAWRHWNRHVSTDDAWHTLGRRGRDHLGADLVLRRQPLYEMVQRHALALSFIDNFWRLVDLRRGRPVRPLPRPSAPDGETPAETERAALVVEG